MKLNKTNTPDKTRGFTLIELMIVIAVAAILAGLAAPNFSNTIKSNRLTNKTNELVIALNIARQASISRNQVSFICHSNSADSTPPVCNDTGSDWNTGYVIYTPPVRTRIVTERVLNDSIDTIVSKVSLAEDDINTTSSNANNFITFDADGTLFNGVEVSITLCDDRTAETGKTISVSTVGRINTTDFICS